MGNPAIDRSVDDVNSDGMNAMYFGAYYQLPLPIGVPFIIAQTKEQISELEDKILNGFIYELGDVTRAVKSTIYGKINPEQIQFVKNYLPVRGEMIRNPYPIAYLGKSVDNGYNYLGEWMFEAEIGVSVATRGTFNIQKAPKSNPVPVWI